MVSGTRALPKLVVVEVEGGAGQPTTQPGKGAGDGGVWMTLLNVFL